MPPTRNHIQPIDVVVLRAPACHLCDDAIYALTDLGQEFPLAVTLVEMESPRGRELMRLHRPTLPPAVLVGGRLFSSGRLPRKKLRRLLEAAA